MRGKKQSIMFPGGRGAFSLVEVLITAMVLIAVLTGLFRLFIYCTNLSDYSGRLTAAMAEAQAKIEEIRDHNFASIVTDYGSSPNNVFDCSLLSEDKDLDDILDASEDINGNGAIDYYGKGVIYINSSNPELLEVEVDVSWRNRDGRIIGEDTNLNGEIDSGEDIVNIGKLDSIAKIITLIAER